MMVSSCRALFGCHDFQTHCRGLPTGRRVAVQLHCCTPPPGRNASRLRAREAAPAAPRGAGRPASRVPAPRVPRGPAPVEGAARVAVRRGRLRERPAPARVWYLLCLCVFRMCARAYMCTRVRACALPPCTRDADHPCRHELRLVVPAALAGVQGQTLHRTTLQDGVCMSHSVCVCARARGGGVPAYASVCVCRCVCVCVSNGALLVEKESGGRRRRAPSASS